LPAKASDPTTSIYGLTHSNRLLTVQRLLCQQQPHLAQLINRHRQMPWLVFQAVRQIQQQRAHRLNERVAAGRRLVDREDYEKTGAPEGALRTATIECGDREYPT